MPTFNQLSQQRLATCHKDLQTIMNEAIKTYNFTIIYGYRSPEEQFKLYQQGRKLENGHWVKVGPTVTEKDGQTNKSKHNVSPSHAVDIAPVPLDWNNISAFKQLSVGILKVADQLYAEKRITSKITWGGSWVTFKDYPHYEIV